MVTKANGRMWYRALCWRTLWCCKALWRGARMRTTLWGKELRHKAAAGMEAAHVVGEGVACSGVETVAQPTRHRYDSGGALCDQVQRTTTQPEVRMASGRTPTEPLSVDAGWH